MQPGIQDGYIPAQCFGIMEQHSESRMSQLSRLGDPYDAHPRTVLRNLQYNAFRTAVAAKLQNIHIPVQRLSRYRSAIVASSVPLVILLMHLVSTCPAMAPQNYAHFSQCPAFWTAVSYAALQPGEEALSACDEPALLPWQFS